MSVFEDTRRAVEAKGLRILSEDLQRPWGGFFVLDEAQLDDFVAAYFPGLELPAADGRPPMSPKILMVAPGKRLSWQYHHRRGEIWSVLTGPTGVAHGQTDDQPRPERLESGHQIHLKPGERHRLVGLEDWGVVAEIWEHTNRKQPSDEDDIVRVEDDFGRNS